MATTDLPNQGTGRALWIAFAAVVASFFFTTVVVQRSSAAVGALSESIVTNSGPSIEHLASLRRAVLEAELELSRYVYEPRERAAAGSALDERLARLRDDTRRYLRIEPYPAERDVLLDVQEMSLRFEGAVVDVRRLVDSGAPTRVAGERFGRNVEPARKRLLDDVSRAIETNAREGRALAATIHETRERSAVLAWLLTASCGAFALLVAWLLHRQQEVRRALSEAHARVLGARAEELEQFSARVAHDIRNPLSSARLAAELAFRRNPGAEVRDAIQRIVRSLSRADSITTALLDFARAGAAPDPAARTDVADAVADVASGFAAEAAQLSIELRADALPHVSVACSPGVYASVLGNLVRNAMKYMGDAKERRITVRVQRDGDRVRTEVADTGPGIASSSLEKLFQPYFRANARPAEGLGLGLATVKKLTEKHGGSVGVSSSPGAGSTFWFELPMAGAAATEAA